MMKLAVPLFAAVLIVTGVLYAAGADEVPPRHSYRPPNGYVPDAQAALRIAEAVLIPIYGQETIAGERPFRATLNNDTWTVEGSMPAGARFGGVALIEISKSDGRILRVTHGK